MKSVLPGSPMGSWPGCLPNRQRDTGRCTRKEHVALFAASELQLVYTNLNLGAVKNPLDGPIRVKASIEYPGGNYIQAHFAGADSAGYVTIPNGCSATSRPCNIDIPSGAKFFSNTSLVPIQGGTYPIGRDHGAVAFHPPDSCTVDTAMDYTLTPQPDPSPRPQYCYIPVAICGVPSGQNRPFRVVGIIGDSIAQGVGSAVLPATGKEVGIVQEACQRAGIGYLNFGINGLQASELARALSEDRMWLEFMAACTDVVVIAGSNDLYAHHLGRATGPALITDLQKIWATLASRHVRVWQATIPPKTHSTDGYRTLRNQSVWNSNFGPEVGGGSQWSIVNAYLRTVPAPLSGIIDIAEKAAVLDSRGQYLWRPGYTSDGTHPIPTAGQPDFVSLVPTHLFG